MTAAPARRLREHGLKATAQRVAVLEALEDLGHASAPEVHEHLDEVAATVSQSTVYQALDRFAAAGLAVEVPAWGGPARYEARTDPHLNVRCSGCGRVEDAEAKRLSSALARAGDATGFDVPREPATVRGRCPTCRDEDHGSG